LIWRTIPFGKYFFYFIPLDPRITPMRDTPLSETLVLWVRELYLFIFTIVKLLIFLSLFFLYIYWQNTCMDIHVYLFKWCLRFAPESRMNFVHLVISIHKQMHDTMESFLYQSPILCDRKGIKCIKKSQVLILRPPTFKNLKLKLWFKFGFFISSEILLK
jgi:hypothetical protein